MLMRNKKRNPTCQTSQLVRKLNVMQGANISDTWAPMKICLLVIRNENIF